MNVCSCQKWYDGTWWEMDVPEDWTFHRDTNLKNHPMVLQSPGLSRLTIWTAKHADVSPGWAPPQPHPMDDAETLAFRLATLSLGSHVSRTLLGPLIGYARRGTIGQDAAWEGFFVSAPWTLHTVLKLPRNAWSDDEPVARRILASVRFTA